MTKNQRRGVDRIKIMRSCYYKRNFFFFHYEAYIRPTAKKYLVRHKKIYGKGRDISKLYVIPNINSF